MGASIHSSEGVVLYSPQVSFSNAVVPAEPLGICEFNATDEGDFRQFFTVGSKNLYKNKPGIARVDWQVRSPALGSAAMLALGLRTAGLLPWVTWGFGSDANDASPEAWQVQDCKVNVMEVAMDGGGMLTASLQGIGGQNSPSSSLVSDHDDTDPFISYESVFELDGNPFENKGFRFSVNHNLEMESRNRGARPVDARVRLWDYLTEGNEEISGSFTLPRAYSKDFQELCPAHDGDLEITMTGSCGSAEDFVIVLSDIEFLNQGRNMPQDGFGNFELPFNAKGISIV